MRFALVVALMLGPIGGGFTALAQEAEECPHDEPTVAALRDCVDHALAEGHITDPEVAQGLLDKLDAAQAAIDRGQDALAIRILESFIHLVEAQAGKAILEPHATHLVEHTQSVIDALGA